MARVGRELHAGGWYHVFNRGLSSRAIFESRFDRRFFLSLLAKQVRAGRVIVHAYCLMTNHYHLLIELPGVDLPVAMREIARHYTRRFNARRDRDGPLFRARFASRYIEDEAYRETVLWYIDQNPVQAGIVSNAVEHPWSSAHDFQCATVRPWLERRWVADVVRRGIGVPGLRAGSYHAMRDASRVWDEHAQEFVASSLACRTTQQPASSRDHVGDWLQLRAEMAEGGGSLQPVASHGAILELVREQRVRLGRWEVQRGGCCIDLHEVVLMAALRLVAGISNRALRANTGGSIASVRRRFALHLQLHRTDASYRARFAALIRESRSRSLVTSEPD